MEYHVPSVALAAQVLKLLSRDKYKASTLKCIAQKLDASPTTCLRVLRTLEQEEFIHCDSETKRYSLGPYLVPLGNRAAELNDTVARAGREIKRIAAVTGLTTAVIQRWDDRPVFIGAAQPPEEDGRLTRLSITVGQPTPLTSGAHGRCFLAFEYDEAEWRRLAAAGLRPLTPNTITDPERFVEALREVRRNGYAISHGEFYAGTSAVDVPVFDAGGRVALVISIMYVTSQMSESHLAGIVDVLREAARKLSQWNGYTAHVGDGAQRAAPATAG
ncbi:MAG TPA: IclR family transcriptional regulator [Ktedonobacterales bacterium]|nr:IclR family transcriptional regulator [Ktedonobacterales bacterium]